MRSEGSTRGRRVVWALAAACIVDSACSSREPASPIHGSPTPAGSASSNSGDDAADDAGGDADGAIRLGATGANAEGGAVDSGLPSVVALTGGDYFECALISDGRVMCWGLNQDGELGKPSTFTCGAFPCTARPDFVAGITDARAISANDQDACALRANGTVACWGDDSNGQIGAPATDMCNQAPPDSTPQNTPCAGEPQAVAGVAGATAIAVGGGYACAVVAGGAVQCWGANDVGELGNGTTTGSMAPVTVNGLSGVVALAAGDAHTCALLSGGTVSCWGSNDLGQLGDGTTNDASAPVAVVGLKGVRSLAAGPRSTYAVMADGTARSWGSDAEGELGDGVSLPYPPPSPPKMASTPVTPVGLSGVSSIAGGPDYACALVQGGTFESWGQGDTADGGGSTPTVSTIVPVTDGVSLGAGQTHTCVLHATGAVECWGTNGYGELGTGIIGTFDTTTLPDVVFDGTGVYGGPSSNGVGASADAGRPATGVTPTMLPSVSGTCPTMASGTRTVTVGGTSMTWDFWSGSPSASGPNGPIVIYWNSGSNAEEALTILGQTALLDVENNGGIIAAAATSSGMGASTSDGAWSTGDIAYADQVVACAIQELHADPSRIHVIGYGQGGLETVYMWYARSGYVASALTYSGGSIGLNVTSLQDPTHLPPALAAHGAPGSDATFVDFAQATATWESDIDSKKGFVIDCADSGGYSDTARVIGLAPSAWAFFKAHPFKVSPEPYAAGLPASFPSDCAIK